MSTAATGSRESTSSLIGVLSRSITMSPGRRPLVSAANPALTALITARLSSQRACKSDRAGTIRGEGRCVGGEVDVVVAQLLQDPLDNRHEGIKRSGSFNLAEVVPPDLLPIYWYVLEISILVAEGIPKDSKSSTKSALENS